MIYSISKSLTAATGASIEMPILAGKLKHVSMQSTETVATGGADPAAAGFSIDSPSGGRLVPFPGRPAQYVYAGAHGVHVFPEKELPDGQLKINLYNGGANTNTLTLVIELESIGPAPEGLTNSEMLAEILKIMQEATAEK